MSHTWICTFEMITHFIQDIMSATIRKWHLWWHGMCSWDDIQTLCEHLNPMQWDKGNRSYSYKKAIVRNRTQNTSSIRNITIHCYFLLSCCYKTFSVLETLPSIDIVTSLFIIGYYHYHCWFLVLNILWSIKDHYYIESIYCKTAGWAAILSC